MKFNPVYFNLPGLNDDFAKNISQGTSSTHLFSDIIKVYTSSQDAESNKIFNSDEANTPQNSIPAPLTITINLPLDIKISQENEKENSNTDSSGNIEAILASIMNIINQQSIFVPKDEPNYSSENPLNYLTESSLKTVISKLSEMEGSSELSESSIQKGDIIYSDDIPDSESEPLPQADNTVLKVVIGEKAIQIEFSPVNPVETADIKNLVLKQNSGKLKTVQDGSPNITDQEEYSSVGDKKIIEKIIPGQTEPGIADSQIFNPEITRPVLDPGKKTQPDLIKNENASENVSPAANVSDNNGVKVVLNTRPDPEKMKVSGHLPEDDKLFKIISVKCEKIIPADAAEQNPAEKIQFPESNRKNIKPEATNDGGIKGSKYTYPAGSDFDVANAQGDAGDYQEHTINLKNYERFGSYDNLKVSLKLSGSTISKTDISCYDSINLIKYAVSRSEIETQSLNHISEPDGQINTNQEALGEVFNSKNNPPTGINIISAETEQQYTSGYVEMTTIPGKEVEHPDIARVNTIYTDKELPEPVLVHRETDGSTKGIIESVPEAAGKVEIFFEEYSKESDKSSQRPVLNVPDKAEAVGVRHEVSAGQGIKENFKVVIEDEDIPVNSKNKNINTAPEKISGNEDKHKIAADAGPQKNTGNEYKPVDKADATATKISGEEDKPEMAADAKPQKNTGNEYKPVDKADATATKISRDEDKPEMAADVKPQKNTGNEYKPVNKADARPEKISLNEDIPEMAAVAKPVKNTINENKPEIKVDSGPEIGTDSRLYVSDKKSMQDKPADDLPRGDKKGITVRKSDGDHHKRSFNDKPDGFIEPEDGLTAGIESQSEVGNHYKNTDAEGKIPAGIVDSSPVPETEGDQTKSEAKSTGSSKKEYGEKMNATEGEKKDKPDVKQDAGEGGEILRSTSAGRITHRLNPEPKIADPNTLNNLKENIKSVDKQGMIKELSKLAENKENKKVILQLTPENLGKVKVFMDVSDNNVQINVEVENEAIRNLINSSSTHLRQMFNQNGLQLNSMNVSLSYAEHKPDRNFSPKKKSLFNSSIKNYSSAIDPKAVRRMGYNTYEFLA